MAVCFAVSAIQKWIILLLKACLIINFLSLNLPPVKTFCCIYLLRKFSLLYLFVVAFNQSAQLRNDRAFTIS